MDNAHGTGVGQAGTISLRVGLERSSMFSRTRDEDDPDRPAQPPRRMQTDADQIHVAISVRSSEIRGEMPGAAVAMELQDREPRAILRITRDGKLVRMEFFESAFSADQDRFLEEYVQAARACGEIAILYPALGFPEDYVLRKVVSVFESARIAGVPQEVSVHGYLYDREGRSREIV